MPRGSKKRKASLIDAEQVVDALAQELQDEQRGGAPKNLKDEELFVIDDQPDGAAAHIPQAPRKRQRASKEKRLTRAEAIVAASSAAKPLGRGAAYAPKRKCSQPAKSLRLAGRQPEGAAATMQQGTEALDVWNAANGDDGEGWVAERKAAARPSALSRPNRPQIAAVEVDPAGCSYNPDREHHQDAIAEAVAAEMQREIARELEPKAPPETVTQEEFDMREMAAGLDSDSDDAWADAGAGGGEPAARAAAAQRAKKTKKDRAREVRRRLQEDEIAQRKALRALRRGVDGAKDLRREMEQEDQERELRRARRQADLEERAKVEPPKLGRHKFQPAKLQVLATDDVTGSLRQLKTIPTVARDRFKSLQKRGMVQVTVKQHWNRPTTRRVKEYEKGSGREKAEAGQKAVDELKQMNRSKAKALKPK